MSYKEVGTKGGACIHERIDPKFLAIIIHDKQLG